IKSAVSIPSNISEGSERRTSKDFRHFIHIALGSAAELRTQTHIAREADVVSSEIANQWISELKTISRMLQALASYLDRKL
ncbi:MAG: four helix bundle protein, partial [candidate division Zixibacteria bacterium]|nr:four helix bundle protein [candidate division Zixibacteria bacterium]